MELSNIKGVGKVTLLELNNENIYTPLDLLLNYPSSYEIYHFDKSKNFSGEYICISGHLDSKPAFIKYKNNVYSVIFYLLVDNIRVKCIFFSSDYLRYKLFKGVYLTIYGRYKIEDKEFYVKRVFFDDFSEKIIVNYKYKNIKAYQIQKIVDNIFSSGYKLDETLPISLLEKYRLYSINDLVYKSHLPKSIDDIHQISRRRKYEEFFWYQTSFLLLRNMRNKKEKEKRHIDHEFIDNFINYIGFELTLGQKGAIKDVLADLEKPYPMNRLIQGDVGCGKSIVAIISILAIVMSGFQASLMLPTEILANQQYSLLVKYFSKYGISVELLTSSTKKKDRNILLDNVRSGKTKVLVGTHSLLNDEVVFNKLGIVVIDEQHKFGVNQRKKLLEKYPNTDALYLSATPIPRTLGLTFFGDLDISSIKTMPKGRIPVNTKIVSYDKLDSLIHFIKKRIDNNEQAYVVCPLVKDNEEYDAINVVEAEKIFKSQLPEVMISSIHGKLAQDKKKEIMDSFYNGDTKILISTTVIEVGVNVKNATIMVILDADRFGLAQIHQLRGRVGRGNKESYCALVTKRLDNERLKALEVIADGFGISDMDFKLRGPGNYFGEEQSGFQALEYASFEADYKIWECAKEDASEYLPRFMSGKDISLRFNELIIENGKQGFKSN